MSLKTEIFEQPAVLERLLDTQTEPVREMARLIERSGVRSVFLAARGSSDNAALYAKYLWGTVNRLPVALAAPSLFTTYQAPPNLEGSLVVGISQSGQSPDIVSVLTEGRKQGALTLAITNDSTSPLATEAEMVLDTVAGPEEAIAATKTYTSQLMAIALLAVELSGESRLADELVRLPELVKQALTLDSSIESAAQRYRYMSQCVVLGRGYNYATAYEWALKLKEMAYVVAEPYSSADFQHGPVAIVSQGFPLLAVVPDGAVFDDVLALLSTLVGEHQAELLAISNQDRALDLAQTPVRIPGDLPEWLSPLVSIVPAQLFSFYLTQAMGYDTEAPRRLNKITRTW
jgi:glucosamine--fructose-6-phosphate aminotransferase (isomerizing)